MDAYPFSSWTVFGDAGYSICCRLPIQIPAFIRTIIIFCLNNLPNYVLIYILLLVKCLHESQLINNQKTITSIVDFVKQRLNKTFFHCTFLLDSIYSFYWLILFSIEIHI